MIEFKQASKTFNTGKANQVTALQPVDIQITYGEYVVIVGANGSGKSTLLNLIAGSIFPSSGQIYINGAEVTRLPDYKRSRWIARVFQNPLSGTAAELSIIDNFRLAALRTKPKLLKAGVNASFRHSVRERVAVLGMGLEDKLNQPVGTLSGGQRQALTLLMSVMDECKILLLDEPTAALDPRSANLIMTIASQLIEQYRLTAILITHNLKDAFTYGNRILHLQDGQIVKDMNEINKRNLTQNDLFYWFG